MKYAMVRWGLTAALAACFPFAAAGEELQVGSWSGTWTNSSPNGNQRPRDVSIEVKMTADPHWRWRGEKREVLNAKLLGGPRGNQGGSALSDVQLDNGALSFSFQVGDSQVDCLLARQDDGTFEGECKGTSRQAGRVLLSPPEAAPAESGEQP